MILNSYQPVVVGLQPTMRTYYMTFLCAVSGLAGQLLSDSEAPVLKGSVCVP